MKQGLQGKEYLDTILDEQEQTYIVNFVENKKMFETIKKAMLAGIYIQGTIGKGKPADSLSNIAFGVLFGRSKASNEVSNEEAGEALKILWEAVKQLESSFDCLERYKKVVEINKDNKNPAR